MSEQFVLGIDVGTSSAKVGLVTPEGTLARMDSESYPMSTPRPGWAEQRAGDWWAAVRAATRRIVADLDPASIAAIGFSNAGGSMVVLDEQRQPARPAIVWMDARAGEQGERLLLELGRDFWVSHTGQYLISFWPVAKLPWLREHEPQVYEKMACVLQSADYIVYRMTGQLVTDRCNACATGLYDLRVGTWDPEILSITGIPEGVLPELGDPGTVAGNLVDQAASELGLRAGTPVVLGAWDQVCAVLGAGSISGQDALLSTGTAWVLSNPIQELRIDLAARTWTVQHAQPGEYLLMIPMSNGGSVVEWYRRVFAGAGGGEEEADLVQSGGLGGIPAGVGDVPRGSEGVLFLPHLIGAVGPHREPEYSGCILGLRHGAGRAQIFRAILEAVAYETRWSLEVLDELGLPASRLRMIGGATRSPIWPQIVADVTGLDVLIPRWTECAVLGAARLAQKGVDIETQMGGEAVQIEGRCEPNPEAVAAYHRAYEVYQHVHEALKEPLVRLNSLHGT